MHASQWELFSMPGDSKTQQLRRFAARFLTATGTGRRARVQQRDPLNSGKSTMGDCYACHRVRGVTVLSEQRKSVRKKKARVAADA